MEPPAIPKRLSATPDEYPPVRGTPPAPPRPPPPLAEPKNEPATATPKEKVREIADALEAHARKPDLAKTLAVIIPVLLEGASPLDNETVKNAVGVAVSMLQEVERIPIADG